MNLVPLDHPYAPAFAGAPHVRLQGVQVLSDNWYVLRKLSFELRRRDGSWQSLNREAYDRGNGAVLLLFSPARGTVVLTRQFRLPAFINGGGDGYLIEACAGLLDGDDPETCIRREAEEETGYRIRTPRKVFDAFMSPGSVTERLHFFVAEYEPADRVQDGGGLQAEGEDIEVIEMPLQEALEGMADGRIRDAKTIMLLQHVALFGRASL
ncbi:MAG: NUDIX domain-containing protein [Hydrogenophaga sp.]|uniref:NUDIX domain-containing protein n=1 Tax=Hydrogenophaga sp. TaxID=1904254 RepID=UPI0025C0DB69|nr:NUDIX domain-containing protein [Hydrogenophaga sp.]MBT9554295.1 NUDIX domain-containing protein [Hydrogenophaga sp.]